MPIQFIHSYLVHPAKSSEQQPQIGGTVIPLMGPLFDMLLAIYEDADRECTMEISFNYSADGKQRNECRDLIVSYVKEPTLDNGRTLAERLQTVTTLRSGLGLFFLLTGKEGLQDKVVISRFRAENGILAEEQESSLSVEFIEKVFLKNTKSYKAAVYEGNSFDSHFWDGKAVDKQINNTLQSISEYWIKEFLLSDFKTTSAAGTQRLAKSLRETVKSVEDVSVKQEIIAASSLACSLDGKATSINAFCEKFGLSHATRSKIKESLSNEILYDDKFVFTKDEFLRHMTYSIVELDNGAILTAETTRFTQVFSVEELVDDTGGVKYSTSGVVVHSKIQSRKP